MNAIATRSIEIFAPEEMTPHLEKLITEVKLDLKNKKQSKSFRSVEDLVLDLES